MNQKQWYVLSIVSYLASILFVKISLQWKGYCNLDAVTMSNIFSCIRGEIFSPFVYLLYFFGFAFLICALLEPKKK